MPPIQNIELGHNVGGGDNGEGVEDFATCEELLGEVRDKMNLVIRNLKKQDGERIPYGTKEVGEINRFGYFKNFEGGRKQESE